MMTRAPALWDRAGLTDDEGRVDRVLPNGCLRRVNAVRVRGDWLEYRYGVFAPRSLAPGRRLLTEFVRLADGSPEEIFAYASRWGALELCEEHDLPYLHGSSIHDPYFSDERVCHCRHALNVQAPVRTGSASNDDDYWNDWHSEPLDAWRKWAANAREILNQAARLHLDDSERAMRTFGRNELETAKKKWTPVLANVDRWLSIGAVRPALTVTGRAIRPTLTGYGLLFGALAIQLCFAVCRTNSVAICSECGDAFTPNRRRPEGRNHYCARCGRHAALAQAQRRLRKAKVHALLLRNAGHSIRAIADALGRDVATIERWIGHVGSSLVRRRTQRD